MSDRRAMVRALAVPTLASLLISCAGIPPGTPPPALRAQAPLAADIAAGEPGAWPARDWWRRYDDDTLNTLMETARRNSPSLAAAQARFSAAGAAVHTAAAAAGVHVDADADFNRQRLSDNGLLPPKFLGFNWYNQADLGLNIGYTFDWWGRQRAFIDAALDTSRASAADHEAAALALETSVAETYFGWQADQARLELARTQVANLERQRHIASLRLNAQIARIDELQDLDGSAAIAREQQISLENSARLRTIMLAALLACRPEELPPLQGRPLPTARTKLPPDVSIDLISRRPDIQASRWRVESAARSVDAARAGFMPDISLRALLGLSSIDLGKLLQAGSAVPQFGAAVHLPIFDAGQLRGRYEGSRAQLDSAIADYDATVVDAAREVGTQALALQDYGNRRTQRAAVVQHTDESRLTAGRRAEQGITDLRPGLIAESRWLDARDSLLQLDAAALDAELSLIRTLGGGYEAPRTATAANLEP